MLVRNSWCCAERAASLTINLHAERSSPSSAPSLLRAHHYADTPPDISKMSRKCRCRICSMLTTALPLPRCPLCSLFFPPPRFCPFLSVLPLIHLFVYVSVFFTRLSEQPHWWHLLMEIKKNDRISNLMVFWCCGLFFYIPKIIASVSRLTVQSSIAQVDAHVHKEDTTELANNDCLIRINKDSWHKKVLDIMC